MQQLVVASPRVQSGRTAGEALSRFRDAVAAAPALGFPAVVKTIDAGAHKAETGGAALDLGDEDGVRAPVEPGFRCAPASTPCLR